MTYVDLSELIVELVFPDGPARENITNIDAELMSAVVKLQQDVPMLQSGQTQDYDQGETFWRCGCTLKAFPFLNQVTKVAIVGPDDTCCEITAFEETRASFECRISNCGNDAFEPPTTPADADGNYVPGPDNDHTTEPCRYWATVMNGTLWIYPHMSSTQTLRVTYRGIKRVWVDADELPDTWVIENVLDPDIARYLKWKLKTIYDACDSPERQNADREFAAIRREMTTDHFREEQWQIDLKNPCLVCCSRPVTLASL